MSGLQLSVMQSQLARLTRHQSHVIQPVTASRCWQEAQSSRCTGVTAVTTAAAGAAAPVTTPALSVDVEYAHYLTADGRYLSAPAWVAVVDHHCQLQLKTFVSTPIEDGARWIGGVTPAAIQSAPALSTVLQQLQQLAAGQLLLGHGLAKDLSALGWDHPEELRFDTMTHAAFCNKAGSCKNLKELAREFLSQDIQQRPQPALQGKRGQTPRRNRPQRKQPRRASQQPQEQQQQQEGEAGMQGVQADSASAMPLQPGGRASQLPQPAQPLPQPAQPLPPPPQRQPPQSPNGAQQHQAEEQQQGHAEEMISRSGHDPQEDAVAVMQLYQQVVFPSTYEGQVAIATAQLLAAMAHQQLTADEGC